jgi:hypothetical protein
MYAVSRSAVLLACAAGLCACGGGGGPAVGATKADSARLVRDRPLPDSVFTVDLSTPDRALRTYWHIKALADTLGAPADTAAVRYRDWRRADTVLARIYAGDALAEYRRVRNGQPRPRYLREILAVDPETETRATVLARIRNVTPIPSGAAPDEYTARRRAEGDVYRYVFERDAEGWKLVQVLTRPYPGDSTWDAYFQAEDLSVPTWTYP